MSESKLYIKNMVCNRCIMVVREHLLRMGLEPLSVELGVVVFSHPLSKEHIQAIQQDLHPIGFEVIDDKRVQQVEQVKTLIIELVRHNNSNLKVNLSEYISNALHHDYSSISNLFSELENTTIEQYYIAQKIERVKELIVYDELSLTEIAQMLNYSSTAHLSAQFKKVTGLTPSHFKTVKENKRKPLDEV